MNREAMALVYGWWVYLHCIRTWKVALLCREERVPGPGVALQLHFPSREVDVTFGFVISILLLDY